MKSPSKKLIFLLLSIFFSSVPSFADTTSTRIVAPGVVHTEYLLPGPFTLDVLEIDLKNQSIELETYRPNGLTRTSVQSAANDRPGHRVIGAVNADFFSFATGWPVNNQVANGKPVLGVTSARSHLAISENKKPYIEQFSFNGQVTAKSGSSFTLSGINTARGAGQAVLYTSFIGASTGTDSSGVECSLTLASPNWRANDTLLFVINSKQAFGNTTIPANGAILSAGSGASTTFIANSISVNDTVKMYIGFSPPTIKKIAQLIGGAGRILKNGVNVSANSVSAEGIASDFVTARHPRTFAGFNADTSKFYLCTVDGRQSTSLGMSFNEMADFLLSIKVSEAYNLDGGGSTTMVVQGKIVNSPSDSAGERPVANSLQVINTSATGVEGNLMNPVRTYDLEQNYPNPFNPATHFRFSVPEAHQPSAEISNLQLVTLKIYDVIGKEVATIVREEMKPGNYTVRWDASEFPSGIYFSRLLSGTFSATRKLVLLK